MSDDAYEAEAKVGRRFHRKTTTDDLRKKAGLIKAIHCSQMWRQFFRDDRAAYERMLLDAYGVESSRQMSVYQLIDLLKYLNYEQKSPSMLRRPATTQAGGKVTRLASVGEHRKILALSDLICWRTEHGFTAWLKARYGMPQVRTSAEAGKVIEGLKAMFERQMEEECGPGWREMDHDRQIMEYIRRHPCPKSE